MGEKMLELLAALPIHPVTGLTALGLRRNGDPIWPVLGGAPEDDEDDNAGDEGDHTDDADDADSDADKPLGPAGEKALEAEKARRKEAITARRAAEKARDDALAEIERLKKGAGADDEVEQARTQAVQDAIKAATSKANDRIIKSEIKAAATGKLANPQIALKLLDLSQFEVDDDGNVDTDEINDAIADLIKKEPYLAAQGRRFQGDADAGPRGKTAGTKPAQVTEEQLKSMSPDEIVDAKNEGRLDDLLSGKR